MTFVTVIYPSIYLEKYDFLMSKIDEGGEIERESLNTFILMKLGVILTSRADRDKAIGTPVAASNYHGKLQRRTRLKVFIFRVILR